MKQLIIMLLTAALTSPTLAGFKASVGPELNHTKTTTQQPYSITQGNLTEEGFITIDSSTENKISARFNFGYDFNIYKGIGIEATASSNTDGDIRAELLFNDKLTDIVTLKVGPSYEFRNDGSYGATIGSEVNLSESIFLDFKANLNQYKSSNGNLETTVTEGSFYTGIGWRF